MKAIGRLRSIIEQRSGLAALAVGAVTVLLIMLMAVGRSIWFDEGYSILLARESYGELLALTAVDAHPPFYYLLLKVWGSLFGFEEFTLRLLSAIFMGGAVSIALVLTKRLFGTKAFLVAIPALVLAPFLLRYGYEVRMYALATLIGVAATYALVRAQAAKQGVWWWVAYAVLVALGMYTLYMTVAIWFAHVAWLLWVSITSRQKILSWRWAYALVGAVVLFIPYMAIFFHQLTRSALPGMGNEVTLRVLADIATALFVFLPEWQVGGWLTLLLLASGVLVTTLGLRMLRGVRGTTRTYYLLYVCMAFVPLLFFAVSSLPPRDPVFVVRYMAHVSIWLYLLGAVVLAYAWQKKSRRLAVLATVVCGGMLLVGMGNLAVRGNYIFERVQTPMTQELRAGVTCNDSTTVVADDPYTYIDSAFYFQNCDLQFFAEQDVAKRGGYAPLHNSDQRVEVSYDITTPRLIHLHWGGEPSLVVDDRYQKVEYRSYDKQHVDVYILTEE